MVAGPPRRRRNPWSRCCGTRPAPSAVRRTRRSSRTICCRSCVSSGCRTYSTTRSRVWPKATATAPPRWRLPKRTMGSCVSICRRKHAGPSSRAANPTTGWPTSAAGAPAQPNVGEHLTRATRAVARYNPALSGVIDLVDFAAARNGERDINPARLAAVVETFSDPRYRLGLADVQPDFLGRAIPRSASNGQSQPRWFKCVRGSRRINEAPRSLGNSSAPRCGRCSRAGCGAKRKRKPRSISCRRVGECIRLQTSATSSLGAHRPQENRQTTGTATYLLFLLVILSMALQSARQKNILQRPAWRAHVLLQKALLASSVLVQRLTKSHTPPRRDPLQISKSIQLYQTCILTHFLSSI